MTPVLLAAVIILLFANGIFWTGVFRPLQFEIDKKRQLSGKSPFVSVVVCARNEEAEIPGLLDRLLAQDYPAFEVVVVDDASTDRSAGLLAARAAADKHLRTVIRKEKERPGKKDAVLAGIAEAKGTILLFTDADCRPETGRWIAAMAAALKEETEVVLGYSPVRRERGALNAFIRFDNLLVAVQYGAFARAGVPYMAVGRNLLYHRSWFDQTDHFQNNISLPSGDDDLPVNRYATGKGTDIQFSREAWTWTRPARSIPAFFRQKRRHLSTASAYSVRSKLMLLLREGGLTAFYLLLFSLFISGEIRTGFLAWGSYLALAWPVFAGLAKKMGQADLVPYFPLLDLSRVLINLVLAPFIIIKRNGW